MDADNGSQFTVGHSANGRTTRAPAEPGTVGYCHDNGRPHQPLPYREVATPMTGCADANRIQKAVRPEIAAYASPAKNRESDHRESDHRDLKNGVMPWPSDAAEKDRRKKLGPACLSVFIRAEAECQSVKEVTASRTRALSAAETPR